MLRGSNLAAPYRNLRTFQIYLRACARLGSCVAVRFNCCWRPQKCKKRMWYLCHRNFSWSGFEWRAYLREKRPIIWKTWRSDWVSGKRYGSGVLVVKLWTVAFQTFRQDVSLVEVIKYISLIITSAGNFWPPLQDGHFVTEVVEN